MKRGRGFVPVAAEDTPPAPLARADEALLAALIDEAARRGIELTGDRDLLALLASVEGEAQIPRELYAAIAAVLSWMDGLNAAGQPVPQKNLRPEAGKKRV